MVTKFSGGFAPDPSLFPRKGTWTPEIFPASAAPEKVRDFLTEVEIDKAIDKVLIQISSLENIF